MQNSSFCSDTRWQSNRLRIAMAHCSDESTRQDSRMIYCLGFSDYARNGPQTGIYALMQGDVITCLSVVSMSCHPFLCATRLQNVALGYKALVYALCVLRLGSLNLRGFYKRLPSLTVSSSLKCTSMGF